MEAIKEDVKTLSNQELKSKRWILIYPPTLFCGAQIDRNAKFLRTLTNNKRPPRDDPGGHRFVD
jgi:hypothetical protein